MKRRKRRKMNQKVLRFADWFVNAGQSPALSEAPGYSPFHCYTAYQILRWSGVSKKAMELPP